ncbi:MAG: hypothetical protein ABR552_09370 [Actinomycetota bacterium]
MTGTHAAPWLGVEPDAARKEWFNAILFPWDPASRRFKGERVYGSPRAPGVISAFKEDSCSR